MTQKDIIMKNLGLSEEEADELLKADKAIDKGEKMPFDLTKEQQEIAKSFTKTGTKTKKAPTVYKFEKKTTELFIDKDGKFFAGETKDCNMDMSWAKSEFNL